MFKFIHTSDWHIYDKHRYGKTEGGRLEELISNCSQIIDAAAESKADRLIIAGDIFHHYNPSEQLSKRFADLMCKAIGLGVKVRAIIGQHDTNGVSYSLQSLTAYLDNMYAKMGTDKSDEYFKIYPSGGAYHEKIGNVAIWYVSWHKEMAGLIRNAKKQLKSGHHNVLVTHCGVLGARTPSGYMMKKGYMDPKELSAFDYVALGDFHNLQRIEGNIWYPGAPIRFRWDERDSVVGSLLVTVDNGLFNVQQVPLEDIEMIQTEMSPKEISSDLKDLQSIGDKEINDAVIRVVVRGDISKTKLIQLKSSLYEAGARRVDVTVQKVAVDLAEGNGSAAGLSIADMVKKQGLDKSLESYGLDIVSQL